MSVSRWLADIRRAASELRELSGAQTLSLVGLRLGAALAATACDQGLDADQLILWDPVVEGASYLQSQEQMHSTVLASLRAKAGRSWRPTPDSSTPELLGFPYSDTLREGLVRIDLTTSSALTAFSDLPCSDKLLKTPTFVHGRPMDLEVKNERK